MSTNYFDIKFKTTICDLINDDDSYYISKIKLYRKKYIVSKKDQSISIKKKLAKNSNEELVLPKGIFSYVEYLIEFGIKWSFNMKYISNYTFIDFKKASIKYKKLLIVLKSIKCSDESKMDKSFSFIDLEFKKNEHFELFYALENAIKKELKTIEYNFPFLRLDYIENKGIDNLIDQTDEIISKLNSRCIKMDTNNHLLTHNVIERLKLIIRIDKYLENDGYNSIDNVSLREFEYNFIYDFLVFFDLMNFTKQRNLSNSRRIDIISIKYIKFSRVCTDIFKFVFFVFCKFKY